MIDNGRDRYMASAAAHGHDSQSTHRGGEIMEGVEARLESVMMARDPEVLSALLRARVRADGAVLDATANTRRMWKGVAHAGPITFMDIDPSVNPDVVGDFTKMPFEDSVFDAIVFDPPHLPAAAASPRSLPQMAQDYGLQISVHADNVSGCFAPFLAEAARVLRPDGMIFAKIKDYVHNHRYQWSTVDFVTAVRSTEGLSACEHIIKRDPCGGNLKSGRWQRSHHTRVAHCSWIVVRKGRCEPTRPSRTRL